MGQPPRTEGQRVGDHRPNDHRPNDHRPGDHRAAAALTRMAALINAAPTPIVSLSKDWTVQFWSPAAERLFGYSADEVVGNPPPIVPEDEADISRQLVERVFRGETLTNVDLRRRHKDGRILDLRVSMAPLGGRDGIAGAVVIFTDETERRNIERQLQQSQKMEAIGQLTGGLSHDFNNLLGVIIGNIDFLLERLSDQPELRAFAEGALNAALRGAELNKRLLAFARRQPLTPEPLQLETEIENLAKLLRPTLGGQITIDTKVDENIWPVCVDPSQLQAAVINLGINARDAMPSGGSLLIEVRNCLLDAETAALPAAELPPGDYVVISVSDTGCGMSDEMLKRVFEPFFTTKEVGKGTGLGLSMVHGFVKQSGGHVSAYSELGRGTTFRLYLPRSEDGGGRIANREAAEDTEDNAGTPRLSVLLVEDNAELRRTTELQLARLGCKIIAVEDAATALLYLRGGDSIDLMLSDIVMPGGMDGRKLATEAVQLRPGLKVLLMSGYADPRSTHPPSIADSLDWPLLAKPFRRDELATALQQIAAR